MHFITDNKESEPDILINLKHECLLIQSLDGRTIKIISPPTGGWTHNALIQSTNELSEVLLEGGDAFLGAHWVGSTEV